MAEVDDGYVDDRSFLLPFFFAGTAVFKIKAELWFRFFLFKHFQFVFTIFNCILCTWRFLHRVTLSLSILSYLYAIRVG